MSPGQQFLPCPGQPDLPSDAIEEPRAQSGFQAGDSFADGGLGQVELFGGTRKGFRFRNGHKGVQGFDVQGPLLSIPDWNELYEKIIFELFKKSL
jgi:hypothetical protein